MAFRLLWGAPDPVNHEELWNAFLEGYEAVRPLPPADRDAIPLFVAMRVVQLMGSLLEVKHEEPSQETWPPREPGGGLPGGDLFYRCLRFLRTWDATYLDKPNSG